METSVPSSPRRKPIVSVVEDDAALRASLTDLLDSAGCQSIAFDSSEHFMNSDALTTSDLIITDIQMGKLDGLGLLNRLREILPSPVPVIGDRASRANIGRRAPRLFDRSSKMTRAQKKPPNRSWAAFAF